MNGKVEAQQSRRSDKPAEHSSPWQLAKRIAVEATSPAVSHRDFVVDDHTVVDYCLLADS